MSSIFGIFFIPPPPPPKFSLSVLPAGEAGIYLLFHRMNIVTVRSAEQGDFFRFRGICGFVLPPSGDRSANNII
jgi:hypothetical protein